MQRLIVKFCRKQSGGRGRPTSALVKTQPLVAPAAVEEPLAPPFVAGSLGRPYGRKYLAEKLRSSGAGELQVSNHLPADSGHNILRLGEVHSSQITLLLRRYLACATLVMELLSRCHLPHSFKKAVGA